MFIAAPSFQMFTPKFLPREFTSEQCDTAYMVRRLAFPAPPPPQWYGLAGVGGGGGGWRMRRVVWPVGHGSQRGPGSYASPTQAINPITWGVFLFLLTLTCT